jgi:hypothetical protein
VLQPSHDRPEEAQLAVSPTARAAHVYLLDVEDHAVAHAEVREALSEMPGVELICWLEGSDGRVFERTSPGLPEDAALMAVVEREGEQLRFSPGADVEDLRGRRWQTAGELGVLDAVITDGRLRSIEFPDPLGRVWSALCAPHAGDVVISAALGYECVDWGGSHHVGGGSHGSLHKGDSLGPLLFVGCGPESADEREQWALADVAPIVLEHFGIRAGSSSRAQAAAR